MTPLRSAKSTNSDAARQLLRAEARYRKATNTAQAAAAARRRAIRAALESGMNLEQVGQLIEVHRSRVWQLAQEEAA